MTEPRKTPTIRAFIAVPVDNVLKTGLIKVQSDLKAAGADVRWVAPDNMHMTLVFLGDITADKADMLGAGLDRLAESNSPRILEATGIGFFGRPSAPRVIWAGLHGDIEGVTCIWRQALDAVRSAGCLPDEKPFKAHLTLGRVKSPRNAGSLIRAIEAKKDICLGSLNMENILLMQSRLTPAGPEYMILHESRLGAARAGG